MSRKQSLKGCKLLCAAAVLCASLFAGCGRQEESPQKEEESMKTEIKSVDINGKKMKYFHFGNKDGDKLIVLPGLALKSVMGSADAIVQAYALPAETYELYFIDHVEELSEGYTIEQMALDTLNALKQLNLDQVHIMGVSQGSMIAQEMALKSPETVKSLVLCSAASRVSDDAKQALGTWRKLAVERDLNGLMEAFGTYVYTPSFYEQYKDLIIASGEGTTELDYQNFIIALDALMNFDVSDQLKNITCPVFVLGAGEDRILGVDASYEIMDQLQCKGYIYEGYGHGVYDEAPDYLSHVTDFLNSLK